MREAWPHGPHARQSTRARECTRCTPLQPPSQLPNSISQHRQPTHPCWHDLPRPCCSFPALPHLSAAADLLCASCGALVWGACSVRLTGGDATQTRAVGARGVRDARWSFGGGDAAHARAVGAVGVGDAQLELCWRRCRSRPRRWRSWRWRCSDGALLAAMPLTPAPLARVAFEMLDGALLAAMPLTPAPLALVALETLRRDAAHARAVGAPGVGDARMELWWRRCRSRPRRWRCWRWRRSVGVLVAAMPLTPAPFALLALEMLGWSFGGGDAAHACAVGARGVRDARMELWWRRCRSRPRRWRSWRWRCSDGALLAAMPLTPAPVALVRCGDARMGLCWRRYRPFGGVHLHGEVATTVVRMGLLWCVVRAAGCWSACSDAPFSRWVARRVVRPSLLHSWRGDGWIRYGGAVGLLREGGVADATCTGATVVRPGGCDP